ncbi:MAG: Mth938-like domain-containing protein [Luteimonas sp.]
MQLNLERPDYTWYLRGADGDHALVNERIVRNSFVIAPDALVEDWPVIDAAALTASQLEPLFALHPGLVLLGTGASQVFPPPLILAAFLTRGLGIEVMTNSAAARTYSVLAGEGRRVVAGFVIPPPA